MATSESIPVQGIIDREEQTFIVGKAGWYETTTDPNKPFVYITDDNRELWNTRVSRSVKREILKEHFEAIGVDEIFERLVDREWAVEDFEDDIVDHLREDGYQQYVNSMDIYWMNVGEEHGIPSYALPREE